MFHVATIAFATARGGVRDRLFLAVFFLGLFVILALQFLAGLSMRQPVQTAISYNLASINIIGLLLTLFLGVNLISREVDDKSIHPILSLPISRASYILGKFLGLVLLLAGLVFILGCCGAAGMAFVSYSQPDFVTFNWLKYIWAMIAQLMALSLLGEVTIFFSTIATTHTLPFLLSCAIYVVGISASAAKDFLETPLGQQLYTPVVAKIVAVIYYVLPNFSFFGMNEEVIYNLPLSLSAVGLYTLYWILYSSILMFFSIIIFERRDIL